MARVLPFRRKDSIYFDVDFDVDFDVLRRMRTRWEGGSPTRNTPSSDVTPNKPLPTNATTAPLKPGRETPLLENIFFSLTPREGEIDQSTQKFFDPATSLKNSRKLIRAKPTRASPPGNTIALLPSNWIAGTQKERNQKSSARKALAADTTLSRLCLPPHTYEEFGSVMVRRLSVSRVEVMFSRNTSTTSSLDR